MTARERLRAWIENHTDQRRFAVELGVDETTLSHYLSGRRRPKSPKLARIEDLTGIPMRSWLPSPSGETAKPRGNKRTSRKLGGANSHAA